MNSLGRQSFTVCSIVWTFSRCLNSCMMPGPNNSFSGSRFPDFRIYTSVAFDPFLRGAPIPSPPPFNSFKLTLGRGVIPRILIFGRTDTEVFAEAALNLLQIIVFPNFIEV